MKDQVSLRFPLLTDSLAGRMSVSLHIAELRDGKSDEPDMEAAETGKSGRLSERSVAYAMSSTIGKYAHRDIGSHLVSQGTRLDPL